MAAVDHDVSLTIDTPVVKRHYEPLANDVGDV
jgi:hypothetical protein